MKNQKGITLIALVVTIIVLLILAGVAIAMLSGENGILNRASESAAANALGEAKDTVSLKAQEILTNYYKEVYVPSETAKASDAESYSDDALDARIIDQITAANFTEVKDVTLAWGTGDDAKKVTLTYGPDGSKVTGTLSKGKITWGSITK